MQFTILSENTKELQILKIPIYTYVYTYRKKYKTLLGDK